MIGVAKEGTELIKLLIGWIVYGAHTTYWIIIAWLLVSITDWYGDEAD
jgi:hypothetical protein